MCAMEAVAYYAGEPHTDHPKCVCPVLGAFLRALNDMLDDRERQRLLAYIPRVVGTARDGYGQRRGWMCVDWLVREATPAFCDCAGFDDTARLLRNVPQIVDSSCLIAPKEHLECIGSSANSLQQLGLEGDRVQAAVAESIAIESEAFVISTAAARDAVAAALGTSNEIAEIRSVERTASMAAWICAWITDGRMGPALEAIRESAFVLLDRMISGGKE
jgi:hypothetical protein